MNDSSRVAIYGFARVETHRAAFSREIGGRGSDNARFLRPHHATPKYLNSRAGSLDAVVNWTLPHRKLREACADSGSAGKNRTAQSVSEEEPPRVVCRYAPAKKNRRSRSCVLSKTRHSTAVSWAGIALIKSVSNI